MNFSSVTQKRIAILACLSILIVIIASCAAPNALPQEDNTATSATESDQTESAEADAGSDSSDDSNNVASSNAPGNMDDSDSVATDDSGAGAEETTSDNTSNDTLLVDDIPVGYTEDGLVYRGDPDAPITIYEYSDYQCPFCQRHFNQTEPALNEQYVASGQAKIVFVDFPLTQIHPQAPAAHAAALCAGDQSPVAFWGMHDLIFETQQEWGASADPNAELANLAQQLDLDMDAYQACIDGGEKDQVIADGIASAREQDFGGTPSFLFVVEETGESYQLVGAQPYDKFADWLDTLAAGEVPSDAAADSGGGGEGDGEIPYWATAEGLAPDPDHAGYTMAGDQYRGSADAKVVVIEFSDFQCPFCGRHTSNTQPLLDEQFVDSGDVRWVFKHFPLNIHAQAPAAGVAAECAAEQGMFWEMHAELFVGMASWSIREPNPVFVDIATSMGLDIDEFSSCLEDEEMLARVDEDFEAGRPFVQGTPTFIVMTGEEGRIIPGALPADQFTEALQTVLDAAQ